MIFSSKYSDDHYICICISCIYALFKDIIQIILNEKKIIREKNVILLSLPPPPQVEEMKGKIRVFCRVRPITESERRRGSSGSGSSGGGGAGDASIVVTAEDEYSVSLNTQRGGQRSFLFDRVFQQHEDQEAVFRDTHVSQKLLSFSFP